MDGETSTQSLPKVKRGRKSRIGKMKLTADQKPCAAILPSSCESSQGEPSVDQAQPDQPASQSTCPGAMELTLLANAKKSTDNLLMPPPAQPDADHGTESQTKITEPVTDIPQEHELIIDGFSLFCFATEQTVEAALELSGKAYKNKRLAINKDAIASAKVPKLPSRDSRSPTGRRRGKAPPKVKEPKTPRPNKKSLGKSPLTLGQPSPQTASLDGATITSSSTAELPQSSPAQELHSNGCSPAEVKKEVTPSMADLQSPINAATYLPAAVHSAEKPPIARPPSAGCQIKSETFKAESVEAQESKPIKREIDDDIKSASDTKPIAQTSRKTQPSKMATSKRRLCASEPMVARSPVPHMHNSDIRKSASTANTRVEESTTLQSPGTDPATCPGAVASTSLATATTTPVSISSPLTSTATTVTAAQSVFATRSNSVHSVTSSNSRQTTPVCTASVGSSASRDNGSGSRAASRNSERNTSRNSQPPPSASGDPFSATLFGPHPYGAINPAMLSFGGPNGLAQPFNHPGVSGLPHPPSGFPFGNADLLPPFSHPSPMAAAAAAANQQAAMRAELSRQMLMQAGDRSSLVPPFFRQEMLFPSAPSMNNAPLASSMPGAMLMQMFDKMPKVDPLQQLLLNQQRNAMAAGGAGGIAAAPVVGPSPFQSPGGLHNSGTSPNNAQKKSSGKWCAAHVRAAYLIANAAGRNPRPWCQTSEDSAKNGLVSSSHRNDEKRTAVQLLSHSVGAITSANQQPKDIPAASTQIRPRASPVPSPGTSSPLSRSDKQERRAASVSTPSSPASFASSGATKESPLASRSLPNGALTIPSPKDWNKPSSTSSMRSTSSSPVIRKRDGKDGDKRKSNGSSSSSTHGKRSSSSSLTHSAKKHRSRSRSPKSAHRYSGPSHGNGPILDQDSKSVLAVASAASEMQQQLFGNVFSSLMNDGKSLSPANGMAAVSTATGLWPNPFLQPRELDTQRDRLLNNMDPALALALTTQRNQQRDLMKERAAYFLEMERVKAANSMYSANLNGYHDNSLSSIGSMPGTGGPPPLIPTSQAKVNLPSTHTSLSQSGSSNDNSRFHR